MKINVSHWLVVPVVCGIISCTSKKNPPPGNTSKFSIKIEALPNKVNAPALQSFVFAKFHDPATNHDYWLLFSGRTNRPGGGDSASLGGLHQAVEYNGNANDTGNHNTNNDYAYYSFPQKSFNQNIYVYDVDADTLSSMDAAAFLGPVSRYFPDVILPFVSSNALARQYDSILYVAGGYGPATLQQPAIGDSITYYTHKGIMSLSVPAVIRCVRNKSLPGGNDIRFTANEWLRSTGGELHKIGEWFYIAGGQHYKETDQVNNQGSDSVLYDQKLIYLTSVVPFKIQNGTLPYQLNIIVENGAIITDVPLDSLNTNYADTHSQFRRRDVVVSPTFIGNTQTNGFLFHGGVFRPSASADHPGQGPFRAWDNALFIQPGLQPQYSFSTDSMLYKSYNVYACPNFVGYDATAQNVHTFLMGGIGDGKANYWVSGFTHSVTQTVQPVSNPAGITTITDTSGFSINGIPRFYGTEAVFIYKTDSRLVFMPNSGEILDFNATLPNAGDSITVGYIYGGIEADAANPGGYQGGLTRATNKIFKVTLYRNE